MTLIVENPKRQTKAKSTIADRLISARDRAVAKVPREDWDSFPGATITLEARTNGQKRSKKKSKGIGFDLIELRDRLAKKVPEEDWDCLGTDGSIRVNEAGLL